MSPLILRMILFMGVLVVPLVEAGHLHPDCTHTTHIFCGGPEPNNHVAPQILVRQGYVVAYDQGRRIPKWVAYKITPDFRRVPNRSGPFDDYRTDPDLPDPVLDSHYDGLFQNRGFARGHLAPYAVMGGDRDGDGLYASNIPQENDPDDALTLFESNYMSNMSPQHQRGFNGAGGIWRKVEQWIQDDLLAGEDKTVWVFAGAIFGPGPEEVVGQAHDIHVPQLFYKIMIEDIFTAQEPRVLAFLLPHHRARHGDIEDYLVSIDVIEQLTGLDFFQDLDPVEERALEDTDTWTYWDRYYDDSFW